MIQLTTGVVIFGFIAICAFSVYPAYRIGVKKGCKDQKEKMWYNPPRLHLLRLDKRVIAGLPVRTTKFVENELDRKPISGLIGEVNSSQDGTIVAKVKTRDGSEQIPLVYLESIE